MTAVASAIALDTFVAQSHASTGAIDALSVVVPKHADFGNVAPSDDVRRIADWALDSGDHEGAPYAVIDKREARVYVFTRDGRLIGAAPVLLGRATGDSFAPGVADMDMDDTHAWQRITPAGRFHAQEFKKAPGKWILWVDYDSAIALHKVLLTKREEERGKRIEAHDAAFRRITYGCINVPIAFYDGVIHATFNSRPGIVYVLPETRPLASFFDFYDVPPPRTESAPQLVAALTAPAVIASAFDFAPAPEAPPSDDRPLDRRHRSPKALVAYGRNASRRGHVPERAA